MEQNQQLIEQLNTILQRQQRKRKISIIYSHNANSTTCSGNIESIHVLCGCSQIPENANIEGETNLNFFMSTPVSFDTDFRKYL